MANPQLVEDAVSRWPDPRLKKIQYENCHVIEGELVAQLITRFHHDWEEDTPLHRRLEVVEVVQGFSGWAREIVGCLKHLKV